MNRKKTENYLDWLHKLRKSKSKLPLAERLACALSSPNIYTKKPLKKVA